MKNGRERRGWGEKEPSASTGDVSVAPVLGRGKRRRQERTHCLRYEDETKIGWKEMWNGSSVRSGW